MLYLDVLEVVDSGAFFDFKLEHDLALGRDQSGKSEQGKDTLVVVMVMKREIHAASAAGWFADLLVSVRRRDFAFVLLRNRLPGPGEPHHRRRVHQPVAKGMAH